MSKLGKRKNGSLREIEQGELTHGSKKKVPYNIIHGWSLESSLECDTLWRHGWLTLLKQIQQAEPDEARQRRYPRVDLDRGLSLELVPEGNQLQHRRIRVVSPLCRRQTAGRLSDLPSRGERVGAWRYLLRKFVAVAPWNRKCDFRSREFERLGEIILRAAQRFAVKELKLRPGFCLHSLSKAESFYSKLKMVKMAGKEKDGMLYFELPQALATKLMEAS